ncbi:MAG: PilN domain-containing protein [Betaproteobacteria bacterium]|nr:PilN domain-containing protein [Betaproteobacteria bacterium]
MSTRINLLPHREERRKRSRQHFFVLAGGTAIIGIVVVGLVHTFYDARIGSQKRNNDFLKQEIAKLDKDIAEIKKLEDEKAALLARKAVIDTLQADRAQTVHLLDELVRQMPEGVYLRQVTQKGLQINIKGYAQSNARVSTLMRNIDASPWLQSPQLVEVKASTVEKRRVSEFDLNLALKRSAPKDDGKGGPAKADGKKDAAASKG